MIEAIAYADKRYESAEHLLKRSCLRNGVDRFCGYGFKDLPKDLQDKCSEKRGGGYWRWKSYIICDALSKLNEDDYLVYLDSGCALTGDIHQLIKCMDRDEKDIMMFTLSSEYTERKWTKRDIFIELGCDDDSSVTDTPQMIATYIICRNTAKTRDFMAKYYEYSMKGTLITDEVCVMGKPNYPEFIENRHDQSILSVLAKCSGIVPYRNPSQHGDNGTFSEEVAQRSDYPKVIYSHRKGFVRYFWQLYLVESDFYQKRLPQCSFLYRAVNFVIYKIILRKYMQ